MAKLPVVTEELLEYLELLFPNEVPSLRDEDRKIWFKVGQVSVIQTLRNIREENAGNVFRKQTEDP